MDRKFTIINEITRVQTV